MEAETIDKTCRICGEIKTKDEFSKNGVYRSSYCRPCEIEYKKKARQVDRRKAHFQKIKDRAREKGIEFSLDLEDFIIPSVCPVLGLPIERGSNRDCWPSLDRIDPNKGYVKGNVIVVSFLANRIKSNATIEQIGQVYKFYDRI